MAYRTVSLILAAVLLQTLFPAPALAQDQQPQRQTASEMKRVVEKAAAKGKAVKVRLRNKTDKGNKLSGKPSDISDLGFVLTDQKTGATQKLAYEDLRDVRQKGMSKGAKIALGVVAGIVLAAVVVGETLTE